MFTGLIEAVGRVGDIRPVASGRTVFIETALGADLRPGDSVAVNGVCLTVTTADASGMAADIGPETMRVTTLGALHAGSSVNLERSMRADSRVGGHFVQGHVDGTGTLTAVRPDGESTWLTVAYPALLRPLLVPKGSIAVDGISLTVAQLRDREFDLMIIPFTWTHTSLATLRTGDAVNLEGDMLGKYVARAMELYAPAVAAAREPASSRDQ